MPDVSEALAAAHASDWAKIVAGLIKVTGNWALAEDCAQDAFATALVRWRVDGVPPKPAAWLALTARNRAIDRLRRASSEASRMREVGIVHELENWGAAFSASDVDDERLRLIFTCCHPALPMPARVALTLRTVAGLTTGEIASAFLVSEATMAQRLVRARQKIENAGIPYRVPPAELLGERLNGVLAVLYLLFNEGYTTVRRNDLARSAIDLAASVVELMPREPEARSLLALMLLQHSRRDARIGSDGEVLTLEEQDRSLWDDSDIARGLATLASARARGSYAIQADIAACHAQATTADDTDWPRIVSLYDELLVLAPTPIIELNRAIAVGMADGPDAGLALLARLSASGRLAGYRLLPAARADFARRAGRTAEAAELYREAIALATSDDDQRLLRRRLASLEQ